MIAAEHAAQRQMPVSEKASRWILKGAKAVEGNSWGIDWFNAVLLTRRRQSYRSEFKSGLRH